MSSSTPAPLAMESNKTVSSATSTTTTISKSKPTSVSAAPGKMLSDANPTSSTSTTVPTSVVQNYVTDAANMISSSPATRRLFLTEVTRMCLERAKRDKEPEQTTSESQKHLHQLLHQQLSCNISQL